MPTGRIALLFAAAIAVVLAVAMPVAAQEDGSVGIRLVDAPTDRADDPRAHVYVVDHLEPGGMIERRLQVANTAAETLTIDLYAAAATIDDGTWSPLDGRAENPLTTWTTITPSQLAVPAGGTAQATLVVDVPDDVPGGEHYAVAWAQPPSTTEDGITVVNRVGVRMYVSVGGQEPATEFSITEITAVTDPDGSRSLVVGVDNRGGRAVDVRGEVELTDGPGAISGGPYASPSAATIAPGGAGTVDIPVPAEIPAGPWTAAVVLRSGTTERTATATLTWPEAGAGPVDAPIGAVADVEGDDESPSAGAAAWAAALALVAVAVPLALLARSRR